MSRRPITQLLGHELPADHPLLHEPDWTPAPEAQLEPAEVTVVGADGARAGWVVAELFGRRLVDVRVLRDFAALLDEYGSRAQVVAVDMPIGLTDEGGREADFAARAFVGPSLRARRGSARRRSRWCDGSRGSPRRPKPAPPEMVN